jgi:uridine kinase
VLRWCHSTLPVVLTFDQAINQIEERLTGIQPPVVIAVDGRSAAGKSTFAASLAQKLDAAVVPGDDFYRVMDPVDRARLDPRGGASRYFDWERMRDLALKPLRRALPAKYRAYDWHHNTLASDTTIIEPRPIVIVEGVYVSRPELESINDLTVLVVADPELRKQRQLLRADSEAWVQRWNAAEHWYFEHVRLPHLFDLTVCGC